MRPPIFVRELTEDERVQFEPGSVQARLSCCDDATVRDVIRAFNAQGVSVRSRRSSRPHHVHRAFREEGAACLKAILHERPRQFGKETSVWPLELAAEVSFEQGLTEYG